MSNFVLGVQFKEFTEMNAERTRYYYSAPEVINFTGVKESAQLVKEKFIYIFKKNRSGTISIREVRGDSGGRYTTYNLDNWDRTDSRSQVSSGHERIYLDADAVESGAKYYFALSRIQWSKERLISVYRQLDRRDSNRLTAIPIMEEHQSGYSNAQKHCVSFEEDDQVTVYLTDWFRFADPGNGNSFRFPYILHRDFYLDYFESSTSVETGRGTRETHIYKDLRLLNNIVCGISRGNDRYRGHLEERSDDRTMAEAWKASAEHLEESLFQAYNEAAEILTAWLRLPGFIATQYDYQYSPDENVVNSGEDFFGSVVDRLNESPAGITYLGEIYQTGMATMTELENLHGNRGFSLEEIKAVNGEREWLSIAFCVTRKGTHGLNFILEAVSGHIVTQGDISFVSGFNKIIDKRFSTGFVSITNKKLIQYRSRYGSVSAWQEAIRSRHPGCKFITESGVHYAGYEIIDTSPRPNRAAQFLNSDVFNGFKAALEIINVCIAFEAFVSSDNSIDALINGVNLAGACIDLIAEFVGRTSRRAGAILGAISGLIDFIIATGSAVMSFRRSDDDAGVGYAIAATGAAVSTAASIIIACTAAGSVVPGIGNVLGAVGALLFLTGSFIAAYFTDDDYEQWLEHCLWGESYGDDDVQPSWSTTTFENWRGNISIQVASFQQIYYNYSLNLRTGYLRNSKGKFKTVLDFEVTANVLEGRSTLKVSIIFRQGVIRESILREVDLLAHRNITFLNRASGGYHLFLHWRDESRKSEPWLENHFREHIERYLETYVINHAESIPDFGIELFKKDKAIEKINKSLYNSDLTKNIVIRSCSDWSWDPVPVIITAKLDVFGDGKTVIERSVDTYIDTPKALSYYSLETLYRDYAEDISRYEEAEGSAVTP